MNNNGILRLVVSGLVLVTDLWFGQARAEGHGVGLSIVTNGASLSPSSQPFSPARKGEGL